MEGSACVQAEHSICMGKASFACQGQQGSACVQEGHSSQGEMRVGVSREGGAACVQEWNQSSAKVYQHLFALGHILLPTLPVVLGCGEAYQGPAPGGQPLLWEDHS